MKKISGIYKIEHKTQKSIRYIGKSTDVYSRWKMHISGKKTSKLLNRAFKRYGIEAFEFSILEEVQDLQSLGYKEKEYILKYKSNEADGLNKSVSTTGWGAYSRKKVKTPDNFKTHNSSLNFKSSCAKGGSVSGKRAKSNVYQFKNGHGEFIFIGSTIICELFKYNKNSFRNWATGKNPSKYSQFKNFNIKILGKALDFRDISPDIVYRLEKSGELLEVFTRNDNQQPIVSKYDYVSTHFETQVQRLAHDCATSA